MEQLKAKIVLPDGSETPFYERSNQQDMAKQKGQVSRLVTAGNANGFISDSDCKLMTPDSNNKAARLYGNPKIHKKIPEGKNCHHSDP